MTSCNLVKDDRRYGRTYCLRLQGGRVTQSSSKHSIPIFVFFLLSSLAYSSILKMEEVICSDTFVNVCCITRRNVSQNNVMYSLRETRIWKQAVVAYFKVLPSSRHVLSVDVDGKLSNVKRRNVDRRIGSFGNLKRREGI